MWLTLLRYLLYCGALRHACTHNTVNVLSDQTAVDKAIFHDLALKYKAVREAKFKSEAIKDRQNKRFFPGRDLRCYLIIQATSQGKINRRQ